MQRIRKDEADRILGILRTSPVFRRLSARRLRQLVGGSYTEQYASGQVILRQGTTGDAFYVVLEGRVCVQASHTPGVATHVATLWPGHYFGELALLSARPRTADVVADSDTQVLVVPSAVFETQLLADAGFRSRLVEQSQERENELLRRRIAHTLQGVPLFSALRWEELLRIAASARLSEVREGSILCRQGEDAGALYVVLEGEAALQLQSGGEDRLIASLGAGASFGEASLLTGQPLAATLTTLQPSTLLVLDRARFEALLQHAPFARSIRQTMGERLGPADTPTSGSARGTVVGVVGDGAGAGATTLAVNLAISLARQVDSVALVDLSADLTAARYAGVADARVGTAGPVVAPVAGAPAGLAVVAPHATGATSTIDLASTLGALRERYGLVVVDVPGGSVATAARILGPTDVLVLRSRGAGSPPALDLSGSQAEVLLVYAPGSSGAAGDFSQVDQVFHLPGGTQAGEQFQPIGEPFVAEEPRSFISRALA